MSTYITRFADSGSGIAVAVKDLIDMQGVPTTAACRALADHAEPAAADALCLKEIRRREAAGEVWLVGKTNLHELAFGTTGVNHWYGTPVNPRYPRLLPGGSSGCRPKKCSTPSALPVPRPRDCGRSCVMPRIPNNSTRPKLPLMACLLHT